MKSGQARQSDRHRKMVTVTLSDEAREKLTRLAGSGPKSAVIESLILAAPEPKSPRPRPAR